MVGYWLAINESADYGDYPSHKSSSQGRSTPPLEIPRSDRDVLVMKLRNRTTSQRRGVIRGGWWEMRVTRSSPSWPALWRESRREAVAATKTGRPPASFIYWAGRNTLFFVNCSFFIDIFCVAVGREGGRDELGSRISWRLFIQQDILDLLMVLALTSHVQDSFWILSSLQ